MGGAHVDVLQRALIDSVPQPALRTEAVPVPRALARIYAGAQRPGLMTGDALTPARIGVLASIGEARVDVFPRPTVAVFSFGDALLHAGEPAVPGRLHDVGSPMLQALLAEQRIESLAWPALPQRAERIDSALGDAVDSFDLVLLTATEEAGPVLRDRLPRLGVPLPPVDGGPLAWRSSRARLLWLAADPQRLVAQFARWVVPLLDALQYRREA